MLLDTNEEEDQETVDVGFIEDPESGSDVEYPTVWQPWS